MSMWAAIKRGFGYGLGGRIGWEVGGLLWGLLRKIIVWGALALGLTQCAPGSLKAYHDYSAQLKQQSGSVSR